MSRLEEMLQSRWTGTVEILEEQPRMMCVVEPDKKQGVEHSKP